MSTQEEPSSPSEVPPVDPHEPAPVIPDTGCSEIVEKYTDLLFTDKQKKEIDDKTKFYYSMKKKSLKKNKSGFCVLCNKPFSTSAKDTKSQFLAKYDEDTYCRTLEIVCYAAKPCKGWELVYGVVFNLEEMIQNHRKKIEKLKHDIIMNKNDLMFGYKDRKVAIDLHETLVAQLEGIMETYSTRLYKYLSYANNNRMNEDIDKINKHITKLTEDIKGFMEQNKEDNVKEAVEASLAIKSDYTCMKNLKTLQENSYKEFLFNCKSEFVEEEKKKETEKKKTAKEKTILERSQKKKETETEKELSKQEKAEARKKSNQKKEIDQELNHLFMTFDIMNDLLEADPDFLEDQVSVEMEKLRNKLKKNGTEDQKKEFKTLEGLYETELEKLQEAKSKKEEDEHSKISEMLSSDNDTPLKEQIESEMEELF